MRHIAHWRSVKHVDEFTEEGEEEGETIIHKRERFSHELMWPTLTEPLSNGQPMAVGSIRAPETTYSFRRAMAGSTHDARRAGTKLARAATARRMRDTTATVAG